MTSAWETIRADARRSPRFKLKLSASVIIFEGIEEGHLPAALGYTRDVSRDGLCLVMPSATMDCEEFQAEGDRALRITLALPTGSRVTVAGRSVYCVPLKGGDVGGEYLVGVKLTRSEALTIYQQFVDSLKEK